MRFTSRKYWSVGLALALLLALLVVPVAAQETPSGAEPSGGVAEAVGQAQAAPAVEVALNWSDTAPSVTAAEAAALSAAAERSNLPGPARVGAASAEAAASPAAPGTETKRERRAAREPQAPETLELWRATDFRLGSRSNVQEPSVGTGGKNVFYTGNWFAARSTNGGTTFAYINPYSNFTPGFTFCCDQVTLYDGSRDMFLWLRMSSPNANGAGAFRLGVSTNGGASFFFYDHQPTNTNSAWTNQWWDYPHMQVSADYLYLTWNIFNVNDVWQRTVTLRWPLDSLRAGAGFSYSYFFSTSWFTFVPVQGSNHVAYIASNWPTVSPFNRINIWRWNETTNALTVFTKTVTAWNDTNRGSATCGATTGNWAARTDDRLLTGARYENRDIPGRKILGFWWNVRQGGTFPRPYVDGAAFYEDTLAQVAGGPGRPYIWNSTTCYLYPSLAANNRGDLGLVVNYSSGTALNPSIAVGIADDYVAPPPGWSLITVRSGGARPTDNRWGDYNTARAFEPSGRAWVGAAHYLPSSTLGSTSVYFVWGRGRDKPSWDRWQGL